MTATDYVGDVAVALAGVFLGLALGFGSCEGKACDTNAPEAPKVSTSAPR